jgi:hypothetical protein
MVFDKPFYCVLQAFSQADRGCPLEESFGQTIAPAKSLHFAGSGTYAGVVTRNREILVK